MEINPQVVFERLFGDGSTRRTRRPAGTGSQHSGFWSRTAWPRFEGQSAPAIAQRLDEYLEDVREIERRLQIAAKARPTRRASTVPSGVPESFDEHVKLQFDLHALAFQGDITRVSTLARMRAT